ncbi:MAG: hypothetical protein ACTSYO_09550 [Candidatus Ranarchaeia archaeon]
MDEVVRRGRGGSSFHNRPYHLYLLRPDDLDEVVVGGRRYVGFSEEYLDPRGGGASVSKAQLILGFLKEHRDRAWFSREVADGLADRGVRLVDVMSNVRRFERRGLVYVRGYKSEERETLFRIWDKPAEAMAIISEVRRSNTDLFDFERMLEN